MFKPGCKTSQPIDPLGSRQKWNYVGAPAAFKLELACQHVYRAFSNYGIYLVGSALKRPDWRDIDVRMIMSDEDFDKEFPDAGGAVGGNWEFDAKWLLLTVSISKYLSDASGLPVDFQFQSQSHANSKHKGMRNALGITFAKT